MYTYKIGVLKFNDPDKRFDFTYCQSKLQEIIKENNITELICYNDFHSTVGTHFNLIFRHNNYMSLIKKYNKKGPDKDKSVYFWMTDLKEDQYINWSHYVLKRHMDCNIHFDKPIINPLHVELSDFKSDK